jgi:TDG/mug DNA glycosylase family protein
MLAWVIITNRAAVTPQVDIILTMKRHFAGRRRNAYRFRTLPDYLAQGLDLVFVGINPGVYSVEYGHYFARPTNRFWPAFSRSVLSAPIRKRLEREVLRPEDDAALLALGIGFTDVVKVPSAGMDQLGPEDYREWAPRLLERLEFYRPAVACFHGVTAYGKFMRYGVREAARSVVLGAQPRQMGQTRLFIVPNPSPRNARVRVEDQIAWYDQLADFLREPTK